MRISHKTILEQLSVMGARLTPARRAMAGIFDARRCEPLTAYEVIALLGKQHIHVNKTTVYRELDFLKAQGLIREISIMGLSARYEPSGHHHHHFICTRCDKWVSIDIDESFVKNVKKTIARQKAHITDHLIEFFGLCGKCKK